MLRIRLAVASLAAWLFASTASAQAPLDSAQLLLDLRILSADSLLGRHPQQIGGMRARRYLEARLRSLQLQPVGGSYRHAFRYKPRRSNDSLNGVNLLAQIPGTDPAAGYLVLSAHYDHEGVRANKRFPNDSIFNGADDNASGTATVLAIAAHLRSHPLRHNVIIALFDAEEQGLQGARAFVSNPPVALGSIRANVNLDMVSRTEELWACGPNHYPFLKAPIEAVAAKAPVTLRIGHDQPKAGDPQWDWTNASDQAAFHAKGIPIVYLGVDFHPDYHQPSDEFEKVDPRFFYRAALSCLSVLQAMDTLAYPPRQP